MTQFPLVRCSGSFVPLALAITSMLVAASAHAQTAYSAANADGTTYSHDTGSGQVTQTVNGGTSGGTSGIGGSTSTSSAANSYQAGNTTIRSQAFASADLATGALHAQANGAGGGDARTYTLLTDIVTFHVTGASAGTMTPVGVDLQLDGAFSIEQSANYYYSFYLSGPGGIGGSVGWSTAFLDSPTDPRNYVGWSLNGSTGYPSGWSSWQDLVDTATEKHFTGTFLIPAGDSAFNLDMRFAVSCSSGTDCNFLNTAKMNFELPDNVAFTSASGLLLTDIGVAAPVPEPAEWALMLGGLVAVTTRMRRQLAASRTE